MCASNFREFLKKQFLKWPYYFCIRDVLKTAITIKQGIAIKELCFSHIKQAKKEDRIMILEKR